MAALARTALERLSFDPLPRRVDPSPWPMNRLIWYSWPKKDYSRFQLVSLAFSISHFSDILLYPFYS